jgi:ABC-type sugar transport system permease subunit
VLLSPVVVGLIWRWILQRQGLLNSVVVNFGYLDQVNWLIERFWAFTAGITVSVWAHMGFFTLILLAGLQAIPRDLYEAAEMDGTSPGRVFWRITLPLLMPNLLVVIILALIRAVQIFDEVYVLTGGGPGTSTLFSDAIHLRGRLRVAAAQSGPRGRRLDPDGLGACRADAGPVAARPARRKEGRTLNEPGRLLPHPPARRQGLALDRCRSPGSG